MMLLGYALHPLQTHRWLQFLKQEPALDELAKVTPHLLSRIHRPYVSPNLTCEQRVDLLIDHYRTIVRARFADFACKAAKRPVTIADFNGKSGALYQLTLSAVDPSRHDGEFALRLMSKGICIYTASFFFAVKEQQTCIELGGLHGLLATDHTMRIKQVTRDLYGCRPRDLMVQAVRAIGKCFDCKKLLLIGNANKLPPEDVRVCKKSSDYDQLWLELGARTRDDGDYELPCTDDTEVIKQSAAMATLLHAEPSKRSKLTDAILASIEARMMTEKVSTGYVFSSVSYAPKKIKSEALR